MGYLFISYSRKDIPTVNTVVNALQASNIQVWLDSHLETGSSEAFQAALESRIHEADLVVVCWTRQSIRSLFVLAEATRALESEKLFPIALDDAPLPLPFNAIHTQSLVEWNGDVSAERWQRCLKALRSRLQSRMGDATEKAARAYLSVVQRLAGLDFDGAPARTLDDFNKCRWEALGLLVAVQALVPNVPESSLAYWNAVFNSGHFVPDEIVGHHSKQSLGLIQDLAAAIASSAGEALAALERADVPPHEFNASGDGTRDA
jgi:hypothetical protein